jgi:hypothetical protein
MAKKTDGVEQTPPEVKKNRKVSPVHVEIEVDPPNGEGPISWQQQGDSLTTVKAAQNYVRKFIADKQVLRIVRVLGTFRKKVVTKETLELV